MKQETGLRIRVIVQMALLVALEMVLGRLLSIRTPIVTIGFGFVAVSLAAMLLGPVRAGIVGGLADFLGALLFPIGAYFPGFTLTAFLTGVIYGLFLRGGRPPFLRILLAAVTVNLVCSLCLDTYWLYLITGKGILALLPARLIKCAVMIPVQVMTIQVLTRLRALPARFRSA